MCDDVGNHGVDFHELDGVDWEQALIFEDRRKDYETRLIAIAALGARLHIVVYVERVGQRRIISARKANSREVAFYERETHQP